MKQFFCADCNVVKSSTGLYCMKCYPAHRTRPSGLMYKKHKENPTSFKKGHISWNNNKKGIHLSPKSEFKKGNRPANWKGDKVGYFALHNWIKKKLGAPTICEICKTTNSRRYEWANRSHKYLRDLSDWMRLCTHCHRLYDNQYRKKYLQV